MKDFARLATESLGAWESVCSKSLHFCISKDKSPLYSLAWINFGKSLITGAESGEIAQWNGTTFNLEKNFVAHNTSITAIALSKNEEVIITGDDSGQLKLWDRDLQLNHQLSTHTESVRGISFGPEGSKILTCSDDKTAIVTDVETSKVEATFLKHGAEVKACDWHPSKGLVMTGGKDNFGKLWDPRTGEELCTLYAHHQHIGRIRWHRNGNWVATGSKDTSVRVHDIRTMKTFAVFQQHKKEVTALAWHPVVEELVVSGSLDNSLIYWSVRDECLLKEIILAHDKEITGIDWHPLGHMIATSSLDNTTKFWGRAKCGDESKLLYSITKNL